jgi:flagellin-like hook-associated protein FlgL
MPSESRAGSSAPSMARSEDFDDYLGAMSYALEEAEEVLSPIDLSQGVQVDAQAESASVYRIAHPLTVPRREAALIPIIGATVPAERLAIYDRNVLSSHPLAGVRITNTSDVQLPSGPATVFDGATYGGDSQIPSMVSGDERLISYAVDLGTSVIVRSESVPRTITSLRITDGVMDVTQREQLTTEYVLDRVAEEPVRHLVMHPKRYGGWTIIGDTQPLSETQSDYRFEIDVPGGSTETLGVIEELIQHTAVQMSSISDSQITYYLSQNAIDDETASILSRIRELRSVLTTRRNARGAIENEIRQIYNDQSRIRQNLEALEPDTELYDRYLTTLADQEDRLEQLQRNLSVATAAEEAAQTALNDYIAGL